MTELINAQYSMLLVSLLLGGMMGLAYDILRCFRRIITHNLIFISLEDFVYWFVCTVFVMDAIFEYNYGEIRVYIFVAMFLGFVIYKTTIGWVLMRVFNYIWSLIKNCLHNTKKNLKKKKKNSTI